jgi:hypothetical protein
MFTFRVSTIINSSKRTTKQGVTKMALFYCVGFPDLSSAWTRYGHVDNHEVYLCKQEAEKANEGLITCVHEFYVKDSMLNSTIERLNIQRANFLANMMS